VKRKKASAFVPRIVVSGLTVSVVPITLAAGCLIKDTAIALAIAAFDGDADKVDSAIDASDDGTPNVIALAQQGFDSGADTGAPDDASDASDDTATPDDASDSG
jgi:hypothetical protein